MSQSKSLSFPTRRKRSAKSIPHELGHFEERTRQLADIAASGDEDNAECAAADLFRESSPSLS